MIEPNHTLALNVIGQMKWLRAGVAAASFGAAVWGALGLNRAASVWRLLFAALDVWGMANGSDALARVVQMLVVFCASAVFISRWCRIKN